MFQETLKDLRKKKGITQAQLAESIYVSRSLIAKYETGTAYPTRETIEKIALYFEVPVSELIGKDETALVALEGKTLADRINFWVSIIVIVINLAFAVLIFIPIFTNWRYVYPIPDGQD